MKVVFLTPEYPQYCGGIGYYVYYLTRELRNFGIKCIIIIRGKKDQFYKDDGIPVYELGAPGIPPFNFPIFKKRIENLLKKIHADILNIHSSSMPFIETKMPIVVTAHCCMAEATKLFYRPIKDLEAIYRNILFPIYLYVEKKLVKRCHVLTVVSHSMQREFFMHYNVNSQVVFNGVDIHRFNVDAKDKDNTILFTGMLRIGKGILDLIEASPKIVKRCPGVVIKVIGKGPLKKYFIKRLQKHQIECIQVIEHLPHSELIQHYQKSLLYVLPSYSEGLPTTILEAMACGLPVVATNVGGIPDLIENGINGFLFPPRSPNILADKVCVIMQNQSLREEMGRNGRQKVENQFTWTHVANRFVQIYNDLI